MTTRQARERAIRKALAGVAAKANGKSRERTYAITHFIEDGTMANVIVTCKDIFTEAGYMDMVEGLKGRYGGQGVVVLNITELRDEKPETRVELPTRVRQSIEQLLHAAAEYGNEVRAPFNDEAYSVVKNWIDSIKENRE